MTYTAAHLIYYAPMQPRISFWRVARNLNTVPKPMRLNAQLRFWVRALLRRDCMNQWLSFLGRTENAPLFAAQPRLALKPQYPYVSNAWDCGGERMLSMLASHYAIVHGLFSAGVLEKIYSGGLDLLHIVNLTTNRRLVVRLMYNIRFEREGDLTVSLVDKGSGLALVSVSFCLCDEAGGGRRLYIGGVQASNDPRVREVIHDLAKEMHGLRAKALALWCVRQLAEYWGVAEIFGVDDASHVTNKRNGPRKVAASYGEFWAESDGVCDEALGFWKIPLQARQRSREELKPSRRKQHERRYEFLAQLRVSLLNAAEACETREFFMAKPEAKVATTVVAAAGACSR